MKQSIAAITSLFAFISLSGALGCGDDKSSGSGVDGKKLVSDITDAEAKQVCQWLDKQSANINPSPKQICTAAVVGISSTETQCNQLVTTCLEQDRGQIEEGTSECETASAGDVPDDCTTITVGEYEACARASIKGLNSALTAISCKDAGEQPDYGSNTTPAECQKIAKECPDLLDTLGVAGGDGSDGGGGETTIDTFDCGNGETVPDFFVCDEERDCDNGKDELNCP